VQTTAPSSDAVNASTTANSTLEAIHTTETAIDSGDEDVVDDEPRDGPEMDYGQDDPDQALPEFLVSILSLWSGKNATTKGHPPIVNHVSF